MSNAEMFICLRMKYHMEIDHTADYTYDCSLEIKWPVIGAKWLCYSTFENILQSLNITIINNKKENLIYLS